VLKVHYKGDSFVSNNTTKEITTQDVHILFLKMHTKISGRKNASPWKSSLLTFVKIILNICMYQHVRINIYIHR